MWSRLWRAEGCFRSLPQEGDSPGLTNADERATTIPDVTGRRRLLVAGAAALTIGSLIAGPATADVVANFIGRSPSTAQEADRIEIIYQGRSYTWPQIYELQAEGKAQFNLREPITDAKGLVFAFDTEAEEHQWACIHTSGLGERSNSRDGQSYSRASPA